MPEQTTGPKCPNCKKPLRAVPVSNQLTACSDCGKRFRDDDHQRLAFSLATANDAWIETVFWKESSNEILGVVLFVLIDFPFAALKWAGWLVALLFFAVAQMWYAPVIYIAALAAFWLLKKGSNRLLRDHLVTIIHFIVFSRGLVIVAGYQEPFVLPWSSIVKYQWDSQVESLTSQIRIDYRMAANQVASIMLHGEEIDQPLGELVDILKARLGR